MTTAAVPTQAKLARWDAEDTLNWTRAEFEIPTTKACGGTAEGEAIYFCGNSLGLLAKKARQNMVEELDVWSTSAVTGHFSHPHKRPWKHVDEPLTPKLAKLLGAQEEEIAHTSTLTSNLHNLFTSFYRPTSKRWKIVIEQGSFPSDWIGEAIIPLVPRDGEETLRTDDILGTLTKHGDEIAVVWLPLVQYYTGQLFDIPPISKKTHEIGALLGLDLAHGLGNVDVKLDEWEVDFAVWCTYKYLNAGPAAIGGMFIRTGLDDAGRRLAGWWGNDPVSRFQMRPTFQPTPGAKGYQHSCTPVFSSIPLLATLELIEKAGFGNMRRKGIRLTDALETLLQSSKYYIPPGHADNEVGFKIISPAAPWRGTQLSLFITPEGAMERVFARMLDMGLVGDERRPSVIRLSPVVLYNTFSEVGRAVEIVEEALRQEEKLQRSQSSVATVVERDLLGPEP